MASVRQYGERSDAADGAQPADLDVGASLQVMLAKVRAAVARWGADRGAALAHGVAAPGLLGVVSGRRV